MGGFTYIYMEYFISFKAYFLQGVDLNSASSVYGNFIFESVSYDATNNNARLYYNLF